VLRPERLRQVPQQFSWVDQALVRRSFIDRCEARAAALYLFLVTVADAQGLSYYSAATLEARLHLSAPELATARVQLVALDLIAYQAPLYQVLALPGTQGAPRIAPMPSALAPSRSPSPVSQRENAGGPVSLAHLLEQMARRRG
jgi:hypothetical protein